MLLSGGDTRWTRDQQNFEGKPIGEIRLRFSDDTYDNIPIRLGVEIREWVSGDATWDVATTASEAEEVWRSSDGRCSLDMIRIEIKGGPKNVKELTVIGECKWLPDDYSEPLPSIRISGVTFQIDLKKGPTVPEINKSPPKNAILAGLARLQSDQSISPNSNSTIKISEITQQGNTPSPDRLTIESPIHLELIRIPAGEFLMGSDKAKNLTAGDDELPQHRVDVSEFYIGRYPITNAQYTAFEKTKILKGREDHPAVNASWKEAQAFCRWLSKKSGKQFRLPTEAEWEKAARGTDGLIYPWGNVWDASRLNSIESKIDDTTPVGKYSPAGDSPYGLADMSGNVFEWCADWYDEKEYQRRVSGIVRDPQGPTSGEYRVVRGGAFDDYGWFARCACRSGYNPDFRLRSWGFRVAASPF